MPHLADRNTFLAALPDRDRDRILTVASVDAVSTGTVLHESGRVIRDVWFPIDAVASLSTTLENGAEAEVGIIGFEGLVGVTALLGGTDTTWSETAVQIGGEALRVPIQSLRPEVSRSATLRLLLQRFGQALLVQASQTGACNRFHSIEQRLARCLLSLHDRVSADRIPITHERLAGLLGNFRPGVTLAARHLQDQEIIRYSRGRIEVIDRARLTTSACECYQAVASEYDRLLGVEALEQLSDRAAIPDETLREVNSRLMVSVIREQQARERAENANTATSRFLATLSDELRTPLAAILGWSDVLTTSEVDDAALTMAIDTIHRNAEAQQHLVDDMTDLARLRSHEARLQFETVDITAAVRAAVDMWRPAADASSVAVTVVAGAPVNVNADPGRLHQILANLLASAMRFTPRGEAIEVAVTAGDTTVEIRVRASGRPDPAPSGEVGMALALAVVRQLVTLHGGSVDVQSAGADSAVTFVVVLPRVP